MKKPAVPSILIAAILLAVGVISEAQEPKKFPRIGYLAGISPSADSQRIETFRQRLRDLGHAEGQNIAIEYRYAEGKFNRLPDFAAELVRLKVDVLVASSTNAALAASNATRTIPIVFLGVADRIAAGLVDSLARPGRNITGFTPISALLAGKRLELLKETIPKLSRVAVLWDPQASGSTPQWKESQLPARELGLQLYSMEVSSADKYEDAFKEAIKSRSAAIAVTLNPVAVTNQKQIADLAAKNRLPAIYPNADFVDGGGLMSYGPIFAAEGRDAARYVDKILKGTKPADLPVEQPTKFELVINLKAAKKIGVTVPPLVLYRADKIIK